MLNICIDSLEFKSSPDSPLLTNIKFELNSGYIYTIIGKNGQGKTTFLKSLTNLLDKNKFRIHGKVLFNGNDLLSRGANKIPDLRNKKIKYVFQDTLKSFDQLKKLKYYFGLFGNNDVKSMLQYFKLPELSQLESLYPYEISYGMAQRLGIIFALASKPEFILMDEPTSALDEEIVKLFVKKIKDYTKSNNAAILIVTHDILFAREISDYISLLENKTLTDFFEPEGFFKYIEKIKYNEPSAAGF